jgi:IMP dehydrogenase
MQEGSSDRYFQNSNDGPGKLVPEGVEGLMPFKGSLSSLVHQLVGGLRAGMGYCGCANIEELRTESRFIKISAAGLRESHVHDVIVTKEAPNYQLED